MVVKKKSEPNDIQQKKKKRLMLKKAEVCIFVVYLMFYMFYRFLSIDSEQSDQDTNAEKTTPAKKKKISSKSNHVKPSADGADFGETSSSGRKRTVKSKEEPVTKKSKVEKKMAGKLFDDDIPEFEAEENGMGFFDGVVDSDIEMNDEFSGDSDAEEQGSLGKAEGEAELRLNIVGQQHFELPTIDDVEKELKEAPNLQIIRDRINDVIQVLGDFKNRRQDGKSREDYIAILTKDLCSQYGYNEFLMSKFMQLFPNGTELIEFLDANDQPRPVTIRTNTLKIRRGELAKSLINRGMNVDPAASWTKVGLVVYDSQVPVGATPEYLAGHYMIQGLNSLLPVMALAPQPGDRILDMCSAPGGKTSHIAALMKNSGVLFANDANMSRCRAIIGNLHRLGVNNTVVSNLNGAEYAKVGQMTWINILTRVLQIRIFKIYSFCFLYRHTVQRQLILAALDSIDANSINGGYLVYSTCSVLVEENEAVVNYALQKRHCELVPTGLEIGIEGFTRYIINLSVLFDCIDYDAFRFREYRFHPSLNLTRRYYPHVHNIDGFFVAKIKKLSNAKMGKTSVDLAYQEKLEKKKAAKNECDNNNKEIEKKAKLKITEEKKSEAENSSEDEEGKMTHSLGSGQRKAKKKRNSEKKKKKMVTGKDDNDGLNTKGFVIKKKKEKVFKSTIGKRVLAKTSAKMIKKKRKKLIAKTPTAVPSE
uniref:SAM_MT_RSMB_NOP domain-containing protein n=1 Tax=Heterorhabditis bacteriophora TaxID=37862 RepID=A0A1I7XPH8_HETBA